MNQETKICNCCGNTFPIEKFAFKNKALNKRITFCDVCRKIKSKESYYRNHNTNLIRSRKNKKTNKEWYVEFKKTLSCCVCGENEPECLDFHHLDKTEKEFSVSAENRSSIKRLKEEISKCACLCANCHRKHHAGKLNASLVKLDIT